MIHIALFEPDIPQNVGAMGRLCACLGMELDIIEPCGFPWDDKKIKRAGMDYLTMIKDHRHKNWHAFQDAYKNRRTILMTTKSNQTHTNFEFHESDILLAGSESAGVPSYVHESVDARLCIPMRPGARSLNIVNATAIIAGEAMRQTLWRHKDE